MLRKLYPLLLIVVICFSIYQLNNYICKKMSMTSFSQVMAQSLYNEHCFLEENLTFFKKEYSPEETQALINIKESLINAAILINAAAIQDNIYITNNYLKYYIAANLYAQALIYKITFRPHKASTFFYAAGGLFLDI